MLNQWTSISSTGRVPVPDSDSLRVLLVEDSSLLAARLGELIRRLPDVDLVDTVETEAAAVERISEVVPDVLILDLHLRVGSGFGVLRSLAKDGRARRPKIVILTNYGLPEYRREAETFGVEAFLDKSRDYFRLPGLLRDFARERGGPGTH
ncbi:MAG: response regulator [Proteobacteria bacterium]|nr:response regulator [Pseudomonadota bacterium]